MKKEVLIAIAGLQFEVDENEALEVISPGEYHFRNGKHYVLYEEMQPDEGMIQGGITKNILKFSDTMVELRKSGYNNVVMNFETGKKTMTCYETPVGSLMIGIDTTAICVRETKEGIAVDIRYLLDINYNHVSECAIQIKITERECR